MSPRAAARLDHLGFVDVWDYVPGKNDWLAFDLPYEGEAVLVGAVVDRDIARCGLDERVTDVAGRLDDDTELVVVVDGAERVMGILDEEGLGGEGDVVADEAMRFGVTTVRPSEDVEGLLHRMGHNDVDVLVVTRQDGVLVGAFWRAEGEALLEDSD